jgi:hypothetical protein
MTPGWHNKEERLPDYVLLASHAGDSPQPSIQSSRCSLAWSEEIVGQSFSLGTRWTLLVRRFSAARKRRRSTEPSGFIRRRGRVAILLFVMI